MEGKYRRHIDISISSWRKYWYDNRYWYLQISPSLIYEEDGGRVRHIPYRHILIVKNLITEKNYRVRLVKGLALLLLDLAEGKNMAVLEWEEILNIFSCKGQNFYISFFNHINLNQLSNLKLLTNINFGHDVTRLIKLYT